MTVIIDERRHYWKDNFLLRDDLLLMNVDIIGKITFSCEMIVIIDECKHYWKDNFLLRDDLLLMNVNIIGKITFSCEMTYY